MLHPDNTSFSAAPAVAGYLYQARLALLLSITFVNSGADLNVAIEKLDDISFEMDGTPIDLLQTKHHVDRVANLTDASADLWKRCVYGRRLLQEIPRYRQEHVLSL